MSDTERLTTTATRGAFTWRFFHAAVSFDAP